jgi:hypothetical protein
MAFTEQQFEAIKLAQQGTREKGARVTLGKEFGNRLMDLFDDLPGSDIFRASAASIRDNLMLQARAGRGQVTAAAQTGGFLDSGATAQGLEDVESAKLTAFSKQITELVDQLSARSEGMAFQFLASAEEEKLGIHSLNAQRNAAKRGQTFAFNTSMGKIAGSGMFGGGAG